MRLTRFRSNFNDTFGKLQIAPDPASISGKPSATGAATGAVLRSRSDHGRRRFVGVPAAAVKRFESNLQIGSKDIPHRPQSK
jgi:hypothetical protein